MAIQKSEVILRGTTACGGYTRGKAKILHAPGIEPAGGMISRGDIIVVMRTNPDYLPLLILAGGIIGEVGGVCSHLATTARELNKPAIVGAHGATAIIQDGDLLVLDATNGVVYKIIEER